MANLAERFPLKFRISAMMELILILGVGTAFARQQHNLMAETGLLGMSKPSDVIRVVGGAATSGIAVAGGLLLLIESRFQSGRASWGPGRWIWSTAALATLLYFSIRFGLSLLFDIHMERRSPSNLELRSRASSFFAIALTGDFPYALAAFCCTAYFAKALKDPEPDLREWSGRLFGSAVLALALGVRLLQTFNR